MTLFLLPLALLLAPADPARQRLADAIGLWFADEPRAAEILLARLHEERPWDDDVAMWLAVVQLHDGRCKEAGALLIGRDGQHEPSWRLRAWEGLAAACEGEGSRARSQLEEAIVGVGKDPIALQLHGTLALVLLSQGEEAAAASYLRLAGGDPSVLEARWAGPFAAPVVAVEVPGVQGALTVQWEGARYRVDLSTGLGRRQDSTLPEPPEWLSEGRRSAISPCGSEWVWSSPREQRAGGKGGVFRSRPGRVETVRAAAPMETLDAPRCGPGDEVVMIRRVAGLSQILRVKGGDEEVIDLGRQPSWVEAGEPVLAGLLDSEGRPGIFAVVEGEAVRWIRSPLTLTRAWRD